MNRFLKAILIPIRNYLSPTNNTTELACFAIFTIFLVAFISYPIYHYYNAKIHTTTTNP